MGKFVFRIDQLDREAHERSRELDHEDDAEAYARQLLKDWPDCATIDVFLNGQLVNRLRPPRA